MIDTCEREIPGRRERRAWSRRWLVTGEWRRLHRVGWSCIDWDDWATGEGVAACGLAARWTYPGVFSRLGLKRCETCCRKVGVPRGIGNPYNGR